MSAPEAVELQALEITSGDTRARFLTYGATLTHFEVGGENYIVSLPDHAYLGEHPYVGSLVGPVANRIADGRLTIDGETHQVATNENGNTLHSGPDGFDRQVWDVIKRTSDTLVLEHVMPDGHQGYPGPLTLTVEARVVPSTLTIDYTATTKRPTPVSLTHHTYFDMPGLDGISELGLIVYAPSVVKVDSMSIPTDYDAELKIGDPLDLRTITELGTRRIDNSYNIGAASNWNGLREAAALFGPSSQLHVWTDLPAVQVYTGEALEGVGLPPRAGLAIEPQYAPDLVNTDRAEDVILRPGETYRHTIRYVVSPPDELVGG